MSTSRHLQAQEVYNGLNGHRMSTGTCKQSHIVHQQSAEGACIGAHPYISAQVCCPCICAHAGSTMHRKAHQKSAPTGAHTWPGAGCSIRPRPRRRRRHSIRRHRRRRCPAAAATTAGAGRRTPYRRPRYIRTAQPPPLGALGGARAARRVRAGGGTTSRPGLPRRRRGGGEGGAAEAPLVAAEAALRRLTARESGQAAGGAPD